MLPSEKLPLPDIYYGGGKAVYQIPDRNREWIEANESAVKRLLRKEGYDPTTPVDGSLSEVDDCLLRIQQEQSVAYAGPLAGYEAGVYPLGNRLILVTRSIRLIKPAQGNWDVLREIFRSLFGEEQLPYFYGWLQRGLQQLHTKVWLPGQALVLAGAPSAGKSLTQLIITEILGGRTAKPYAFMSGRTTFNGDLFPAEHLAIEDEAESQDIRSRRAFGCSIKNLVASRDQPCHAKFKDQLILRPMWRVTMSMNQEKEHMHVLPPLHGDIQDKVMLFKVNRANLTLPTEAPRDREAFWERIRAEIPALVHHLLNEFVLPENLRSERYGVKHYHHPELVQALHEISPECALLSFIDERLFAVKVGPQWEAFQPFEGTAQELETALRGIDQQNRRLEKILTFNSACGTYLGRLEGKFPERVKSRLRNGHTIWTVQPPPQEQENQAPREGGDR